MTTRFDTLIVGAGHGGVQAAAELAKAKYAGTIGILSAEPVLPYERPALSKGYLMGEQTEHDLLLRSPEYWKSSPAQLHLSAAVKQVDPGGGTVTTADGESFGYGSLIWAAGGRARSLPLPGSELEGVFTVRDMADSARLSERAAVVGEAAVIGGGYIGLEVAAALRKFGLAVTLLEEQDRLLARVTSTLVSEFYLHAHREHGSDIRLRSRVTAFRGTEGSLTGVVLADGEVLPAQIAVIGVGMQPNIEPLALAGAAADRGGVQVDDHCRTTLPGIYAIGDCTTQCNPFAGGSRIRLESVQNAVDQATIAVSAIVDGRPPLRRAVPWFWSNQYDLKLKTVGLLAGHDTAIQRGEQNRGSFSVAYLRQGELVAMDCVNSPRDFAQARSVIEARTPVDPALVADPAVPLQDSRVARLAS
jgi:3-phenylpropionate/trans-cinnamate dioxygenase ferredoxin reductase subunit